MTKRPISLRTRVALRLDWLGRWLSAHVARIGPGVFIASHWPWPIRKPFTRAALILQPVGGGFGDELMCTAIFEEIKRRNPRCHITFVTRRPDFFRGQPFIDAVEKETTDPRLLRLTYRSDLVTPPPRPLLSLMGECVGIKARFPRIPPPQVNPSPETKRMIGDLPGLLVVVQPRASKWTTNKDWPVDYWRESLRGIAAGCPGCHIVEVGTDPLLPPEEMGPNFISLAGRTSLDDFAYIISKADLFIAPPSSGMHLANSYDIPSLIIFGGFESPAGFDFANIHPLYSPVPCAPCWRQTCPYNLKCLHAIAPATVAAEALRLLLAQSHPRGQS